MGEKSFSQQEVHHSKRCGIAHAACAVHPNGENSNGTMRPQLLPGCEAVLSISVCDRSHRQPGSQFLTYVSLLEYRKALGLGLSLMGGKTYCQGLDVGTTGRMAGPLLSLYCYIIRP